MATEGITAKHSTWTMPGWLQGLIALGLISGGLGILILGWVQTSSPLVVEVDGHRYQLRTHATTVGDGLRNAGLNLYPEDIVLPELAAPLHPDVVIQVQRAQPAVLSADGQVHHLRTHAKTVGELLREAGVQLGPADEIWLGGHLVEPDTPLSGSPPGSRRVSHRGGARLTMDRESNPPPVFTLRRAASLTLDDGGVTTTLHTTLETVGQVLQEHGVTLFLGDKVTPGLQNRVAPGMAVQIHRSVPVQIQVDGRTIRTRTLAETVAGVLGQEGIALVGKDRTQPAQSDPIRPNLTVQVTRVKEAFIVEFDPIPFETVWVSDPEVEIDRIRLVQAGQIGLNKRRYRVVYEDDEEVDRFLEDTWAEQQPITKTMAYGTKIIIRTLETPKGPIEYWRKMRVYATSYRPASAGRSKSHPRYGYTRLGWQLQKGIVAVDPTIIPLRSRIYVPDYGIARAGDTGGGVKGKLIDLGFSDSDYQSWHWWTDIYLLTPVPSPNKIRWILPDYPRFPDRGRR